jgi:hypothetical protein
MVTSAGTAEIRRIPSEAGVPFPDPAGGNEVIFISSSGHLIISSSDHLIF